MNKNKIGFWIFGINGNIGSSLIAINHISSHEKGIFNNCLSNDKQFENLNLIDFSKICIGGIDLHKANLKDKFKYLISENIIPSKYQNLLNKLDAKKYSIESYQSYFKNLKSFDEIKSQTEIIKTTRDILKNFKQANNLDKVICINLISTEESFHKVNQFDNLSWKEFERTVIGKQKLSNSTLYAISALQENCHYINFTPNTDIEILPLQKLAQQNKICFAGKDGKTGETLIKSALAPLFEIRKLNVLSWLSYNLLGNNDGKNLSNPSKKQTKVTSKNEYLSKSLKSSKELFTKIEIDYVPSLGDWKTAMNFIHFEGILNTKMTMQFTWQGCDTTLALPLIIDLVRFTDYFSSTKKFGYLDELNLYFKSGLNENDNLVNQYNHFLNSLKNG